MSIFAQRSFRAPPLKNRKSCQKLSPIFSAPQAHLGAHPQSAIVALVGGEKEKGCVVLEVGLRVEVEEAGVESAPRVESNADASLAFSRQRSFSLSSRPRSSLPSRRGEAYLELSRPSEA